MSDRRAGGRAVEREQLADRVKIEGHPGYYRRGDAVVFPYRDRRGRQRWGRAKTLTEARRRKAALITDVDRGEHRPQAKVGFTTYGREWVDTYQGRTSKAITAHTRADYSARLEQDAFSFFAETPLGLIEPQDIKAFAAHVGGRGPACKRCRGDAKKRVGCEKCEGRGHEKGQVSPDTVRLALAPVKALFATAFEDGVIRVNPAAGVRVLRPRSAVELHDDDEGPVKAMSEDELVRLFTALAAKETWARSLLFFRVLLELGLRISEAIELRWRDVDLGAGTVKIRRNFYEGEVGALKSKYSRRTLRLTKETSALLWQLRKDTRARDGDLLFTAAQGGRIDASNLMARVLKKAAVEAGVGDWIGFHTFRHTCATLLFTKAHWNPKQVQQWLGHHSASFTLERYIHLLPDDVPDAAAIAPEISIPLANAQLDDVVESADGVAEARAR